MAQQKITQTEMKHKDGKKRRKLVRNRLYQNGQAIDLSVSQVKRIVYKAQEKVFRHLK